MITYIPAPKKASQAIRMAMNDLAKAEASPHYRVSMASWHLGFKENKCAVCLAGSIIAFSMNASRHNSFSPHFFNDEWKGILIALDNIRRFSLEGAAMYSPIFDVPAIYKNYFFNNLEMPSYSWTPDGIGRGRWRRWMYRIANLYEAHGH